MMNFDNHTVSKALFNKVGIAPLVTFRIIFGSMMFFSIMRFALNGWIESLYLSPTFHFKYFAFSWVSKPDAPILYAMFVLMAISCVGIVLGAFYRWSIGLFFILFTYIELIDISYYLNHYYFISIMAGILFFLPANRSFSIDAKLSKGFERRQVDAWTILIIKFQLMVVYFYAGIAKLNTDWLVHALPLKIWLPGKSYWPIIGPFLEQEWVAYFFSWSGAAYDLLVPFSLLYKKTRPFAYVAVVIFHVFTGAMFQIGMFPYIMIVSTLVFFDEGFHKKILNKVGWNPDSTPRASIRVHGFAFKKALLFTFVLFQLLFPFRYLAYPGSLFWTEQGYRFSWRVMLIEKAGATTFRVRDADSGKEVFVSNYVYLTPFQEKQMATQPDLILQFAHFLGKEYKNLGFKKPEVYTDSFVALNGVKSTRYIDPEVDLLQLKDSFEHKQWILPLKK